MDLRRLEGWIDYCRTASSSDHDAVSGGGWMVSQSTPPPVQEHPLSRIPLERAEAIRLRLETELDPAARTSLKHEAIGWLSHPHPATTPERRRLMERELRVVEATGDA